MFSRLVVSQIDNKSFVYLSQCNSPTCCGDIVKVVTRWTSFSNGNKYIFCTIWLYVILSARIVLKWFSFLGAFFPRIFSCTKISILSVILSVYSFTFIIGFSVDFVVSCHEANKKFTWLTRRSMYIGLTVPLSTQTFLSTLR